MRPSVQKLRILLERICKSRRWRGIEKFFSCTKYYIVVLYYIWDFVYLYFGIPTVINVIHLFLLCILVIRQVFFDSVIQCRSCTKRQSCSGSFQVFYSSLSLLSSFILFSFLFLDILWFFLSLTLMYCTFFPIVVSFRRDTSPYMK